MRLNGCACDHQHGFLEIGNCFFLTREGSCIAASHFRDAHQFRSNLLRRPHQVELAFHGALQRHIQNKQAVYFIGAFKDAVYATIEIRMAYWVLITVTVAAMNLHAFISNFIIHLAAEHF